MRNKLIYWVIPVLLFVACNGQLSEADYSKLATADSTAFSSDITSLNSPSRKQIRTADIRCRVNNVLGTTLKLEQLIHSLEGVVAESHLENQMLQVKEFSYKTDSLKRVQEYVPTANLTLKVPVKNLDSVVNFLSESARFINYRTLKQEDATYRYLSNALKNEAVQHKEAVRSVPAKRDKLEVIKYTDNKQESAIDRRIENLQLLDDVEYATFTVQLFQPESHDITTIADPAQISRAGFGTEILTSLQQGAEIFRAIVLFVLKIWPLWMLLIVLIVAYKRLYYPIQKRKI